MTTEAAGQRVRGSFLAEETRAAGRTFVGTAPDSPEAIEAEPKAAVRAAAGRADLAERLAAVDLQPVTKGGGRAVRRRSDGVGIGKASDCGCACSRLVRRCKCGCPGHAHARRERRVPGAPAKRDEVGDGPATAPGAG